MGMEDQKHKDPIDKLGFQVEKSMRYHQRIRGHYDTWNKVFMFVIIILGSGAISDRPSLFVMAAAIIAAANLVWSPSHRARDHEILFRRFSDLAILIRSSDRTATNLQAWIKQRIMIESDEPPIFYALEADCDNQVRRAWGRVGELVRIGWWRRQTMYWLRHVNAKFPEVPNPQASS